MNYVPKVYRKQGGDQLIVASGGVVDVESGGALKLAGTQVTASAAQINAAAAYIEGLDPEADELNAGLALVGAMTGGSNSADHADDTSVTAVEVMAANGDGDGNRAVLIIVKCTQTFAATTNKPIFEIGDGTVAAAFATIGHGGSPDTMTAGGISVFAGTLTEERPVEITVTNGTGGTEAGAIQVFVIALPVTTV